MRVIQFREHSSKLKRMLSRVPTAKTKELQWLAHQLKFRNPATAKWNVQRQQVNYRVVAGIMTICTCTLPDFTMYKPRVYTSDIDRLQEVQHVWLKLERYYPRVDKREWHFEPSDPLYASSRPQPKQIYMGQCDACDTIFVVEPS